MASMAELARQLLGMNGNSVGGVSPDRYMEIMDRSPYGTGVPLEIGYGEQDQMSPLDAAAMVTGGVPVVGDLTGLAADVDMYMRDPESRNIPNYLLTAAGALPFLPAASQVRQGIKAYHGSPHDFPPVRELEMPDGAVVYQHMDDAVPEGASVIKEHPLGRFDMSKLGTGEGAQAYGQGLYFAESEDVARGYRKNLSRDNLAQRAKDDQSYDTLVGLGLDESPDLGDFSIILSDADGDMARAIQDSMTPRYPDDLLPAFAQSMADAMKSGRLPASIELPTLNKGSMYEVNIDVEPDELLDWDKPMAEQSALVKQAFNFDPPPKPNFTAKDVTETGSSNPSYKYSVNQFPAAATIEEALSAANKPVLMHTGPTGSVAYKKYEQALSDPMSDPTGAITAAQNLQEKGIKGIRYADAFTRHKTPDKRSMNYVIFDDRLITIAKKYGISIPAAAAMLARMTGEDTSQSYQEAS
jgi:hypothetical protein